MLSSTKTYRKRVESNGGVLPFSKRRLRRKQIKGNFATTTYELDDGEYCKLIAKHFSENEYTWNMVKDLVTFAKSTFEETYETSGGGSKGSDMTDDSDVGDMFQNIRVVTEKMNLGNINLNEEDMKAFVYVLSEIIRKHKYYGVSAQLTIIRKLEELSPVFRVTEFLKFCSSVL